jgi:hypothetical protein
VAAKLIEPSLSPMTSKNRKHSSGEGSHAGDFTVDLDVSGTPEVVHPCDHQLGGVGLGDRVRTMSKQSLSGVDAGGPELDASSSADVMGRVTSRSSN